MGKRNKEKFSLKTPNATIGIRGTTFIAQYVPPETGQGLVVAAGVALNATAGNMRTAEKAPRGNDGLTAPALPPGLHLQVIDGAIIVTNNGGQLGFDAGQFGYVPGANQAPVIVPPNTGLQFVPPAGGAEQGAPKPEGAVDCIVR